MIHFFAHHIARNARVGFQVPLPAPPPPPHPPCESNTKIPNFDRSNTLCCSDNGIVCARRENTQAVTVAS